MPCYVKSKKKKGFIITEYRIDGKTYMTGKRIKKPKLNIPNPMNF